jgi:hypothetical protein
MASTKVTGKHTGSAFSPAPHLDPVPTSPKVSHPRAPFSTRHPPPLPCRLLRIESSSRDVVVERKLTAAAHDDTSASRPTSRRPRYASLNPFPLPPPSSQQDVVIGPEDFTVYANAEGKLTKITIEPKHEGSPVGPPGFYISNGGVMKPPPAAAPAGPE